MNPAAAALLATTAIQTAAAAAVLTLPAVAPLVAADLGLPTSLVGTYLSLTYVGAAASALAGGAAVPRIGALRLSQASLLACAAGLLLGLVPMVVVVALSAVLLGIGYGPITPASSHLLARTTPPARMGLTFSIKQTGVPAGAALAGLVVPPLALVAGWRVAVAAIAVLGIGIALAAQPVRNRLDDDRRREARFSLVQFAAALRLVAATPALRTMAAVSFVYAGLQMCVSGFIVAYLAEEVGLSLVAAGVGLTVANVAGVAARIGWGAFADRVLSPRATLAMLGGLMAAFSATTALFTAAWPLPAMLAVVAALGGTAIGWNGVYLAETARVAPAGQAALATGGCLFFTYVGVVCCPFLFGLLQRASGSYALSFAAAAVAYAIVAAVLALRRRPAAA
ncbi:MAG: MFS transporter [Burkholderiales bacterium]|jgi:MFS family permease|nr:MFS transporter [Burkholderiales bacterium]